MAEEENFATDPRLQQPGQFRVVVNPCQSLFRQHAHKQIKARSETNRPTTDIYASKRHRK